MAADRLAREKAEIIALMRKLEAELPLTAFEKRLLAMFRESGVRFKGDRVPLDATVVKICSLPHTPMGGSDAT